MSVILLQYLSKQQLRIKISAKCPFLNKNRTGSDKEKRIQNVMTSYLKIICKKIVNEGKNINKTWWSKAAGGGVI